MSSPLIAADPNDLLAGRLSVQGNFARANGEARRGDDLVGSGFSLIISSGDPSAEADPQLLAWFASIGGTIATLDPVVEGHLTDTDRTFTGWLEAHNASGLITRPDQYVFGSTSGSRSAESLLGHLRTALG
jgi:flavoprotein hydroxylase